MKGIVELFIEDRMWPGIYTWKPEAGKKQGGWDRFSTDSIWFSGEEKILSLKQR